MIAKWIQRLFKRTDEANAETTGYHPQPENMDLIGMVQNARMAHDDDAIPSQMSAVYWIEAKQRPTIDAPTPTPRAGEFRIATDIDHVDVLWKSIQQATQDGKLGYKSKVSTTPAFGQNDPDARMICVRTYDADDKSDRARVEATLGAILQVLHPDANPKPIPYALIR